MVAEAAKTARPGEWILGRGWHQEKWSEVPSPNVEGFPLHDALSRVSPNNPVWLTHASGHAGFANALAMKMAEVTKDDGRSGRREDPEGQGRQSDGPVQRARAVARRRRARARPRHAHAGAGRSGSAPGDRARLPREPRERPDDGERRRFAAVDHRGDEEGGRRRQAAAARLDDAARDARQARRRHAEIPRRQLRRQAVHRARHQARHRRRARLARRVDARAVRRSRVDERHAHRLAGRHPDDRGAGDQERLPDGDPRDRRSRQPRGAEHLRRGVQDGIRRRTASCAGGSSTRSTSARPTSRASASSA